MSSTELISGVSATTSHVGRRRPTPLAGLWILAALLIAAAAMFARDYPYAATPDQLTDLGKLAGYDTPHFVRFVLGVAVLTIAAAAAPSLARRAGDAARYPVIAGAVGAATAFLLMYPVSAIDVFIYAARSRLFTHYGLDPLVARPADHGAGDPFLSFASAEWADDVSPYGPIWNLIAGPATRIAGDDIAVAIWGLKVIALLAFLACGACIWLAVSRWRPGYGAAAATVFWWNPVVLWEGVGNAHNDLVMLVPLLLAIVFWTRGRSEVVVPLIVAAAMIKYAAIIVGPAVALALLRAEPDWRARGRLLAGWIFGSALVVVSGLSPFYDPRAILGGIGDQADILMTSPGSVLWVFLRESGHDPAWRERIIIIGQAITAAATLALAGMAWRRPDRLVRYLHETLVVFVLVGIPALRPWYAIWIVAFAALVAPGWATARAVAWGTGAVAYYAITIWVWDWTKLPFTSIQPWFVLMLVGPGVFLALAEIGAALRRRRRLGAAGFSPA